MKLTQWMTINALVYIGLGIAFALYGPIMIALFGVLEFSGADAGLYWYIASFARLFGATLFGFGFLIWAARNLVSSGATPQARRSLLLALLLANAFSLFVVASQQYSVWASPAGWAAIAVFLLGAVGYAYFLAVPER